MVVEIIVGILCVAFGVLMFPFIVLFCKYAAEALIPPFVDFLQSYKEALKDVISIVFKGGH
jgi:hypothetical protein